MSEQQLPLDDRMLTEADLLDMLARRHGRISRNGGAVIPQHAFIPKVRSAAAFDARRTIDAVAMALWPSQGLLIDAFEIKCSRADWRRELKDPTKAGEFLPMVDRMWVVAAHAGVVADGELPERWGLLIARGRTGLREHVAAQPLHDTLYGSVASGYAANTAPLPPGFSRGFLAALLRKACRVGDGLK